MKKAMTFLIFLLATTFVVFTQQDKPLLSVLDFEASGISKAESRIFVDFVSSYIVASNKYRVIDRTQRETILQEIEFSLTDCSDEKCQLEVGKLLSASQIIVGSIGKVGSWYILNMKLITVETGETVKTASDKYETIDALIEDSENLTHAFIGNFNIAAESEGPTTSLDDTKKNEEGAIPALIPPEQQAQPQRRGSAIEATLGYSGLIPFWNLETTGLPAPLFGFYLSSAFTYKISNLLSLGAQAVFHSSWYDLWNVFLNTTTIGPKLIIGNQVDGFAVGLTLEIGIIYLGGSIPFFPGSSELSPSVAYGGTLYLYFRNFMVSVAFYLNQTNNPWILSAGVGYSFFLGSKKQ